MGHRFLQGIKEGHFETGSLKLRPEWLEGSIIFLEEGATILTEGEPGVLDAHS